MKSTSPTGSITLLVFGLQFRLMTQTENVRFDFTKAMLLGTSELPGDKLE